MLIVPTKKTDSSKIFKNCEKYIRKNYDKATVEKVKPYLSEGDTFRDQVVATATVGYEGLTLAIQNTAKYYRFIKSMESWIPIGSTELKFIWYDSVNRRKIPVLSYKLEKTCLLYNLASLYSRQGAEIDLRATDAHKIALNAFQVAIGCLNEVVKLGIEARLENNIDLAPENLAMHISILTAQCYFIMYNRVAAQAANKLNLAKLAYTIHKHYDQAYNAMISVRLARDYPDEPKNQLRFNSGLYLSLSSYWQSFPEREEGLKLGSGFGKGVSRLRVAHEAITRAMQIKGLRGPVLEKGREVLAMVTREKETAEAENISVYMDGIPDPKTLATVDELTMVQAKFPPPVDIDSGVTGQEVLLCLVPKEVIALAAEYKELLHVMVMDETRKIADNKREKDSQLEALGLPQKINALSHEAGLPEAIWKKIQQVQVSGGFFQLENSMASLRTLSENCGKNLNEFVASLNREEEEDKGLRQAYGYQWNRATSQAINASLRADIDKYGQKLAQAMQLDLNSQRTWESNQATLQMLKKGKNELDSMLPANEAEENPNLAAEHLKGALDQLTASENLVNEALQSLQAETEVDNIIEAILKLVEAKLPKENTFAAESAKHNPKREEINAKIAEFRRALQTVVELNTEFERVKGNIRGNPVRLQILSLLENAVKVYNDLSSLFSQGHQFYANLGTHISVLQQKVADFIYSRNIEKNDLMGRISGKAPGGGANAPNPYGQFFPPGNAYAQYK
jgi:hypothetical protein